MPHSDWEIPNDESVCPADIQPGANLKDANLTEANLKDANLTEANLKDASLTEADLGGADLSGANLRSADFPEANLRSADLSEANLFGADLPGAILAAADLSGAVLHYADFSEATLDRADFSEADLYGADLSEATLKYADLDDANLREITLTNATLARTTDIGAPRKRIAQKLAEKDSVSEKEQHDIIARTNHELRAVYSANGLISQARLARVRERRARRKEALAEEGWRGTVAWFGSLLSRVFTGYGVQLIPVIVVMMTLYLVSAVTYSWEGMPIDQSLYYSVVTFTTAPPTDPSEVGFGTVGTLVAGLETFAGTAAIVFLGYVLGTRERV